MAIQFVVLRYENHQCPPNRVHCKQLWYSFFKSGFNSVNVCPDRTVDDIDELIRSQYHVLELRLKSVGVAEPETFVAIKNNEVVSIPKSNLPLPASVVEPRKRPGNRTETENPVNRPFLVNRNRNRIFQNLKNRNRTVTEFSNTLKTETKPEKLAFFAGSYSIICLIFQ